LSKVSERLLVEVEEQRSDNRSLRDDQAFEDERASRILAETSLLDMQEHVELRERFIGVLAHDLRNPLSVITMALQQVLSADDLSLAHRKTLTRAATNAGRMARMISELLDFARCRSGGIPVTFAPAELVAICRQAVEEIQAIHSLRKVTLAPSVTIEGHWDRDRLNELLCNLLSNAIHYSPVDSPVRVAVRLDSTGSALVEIQNQGDPIPPDEFPLVFDPFRRGRKERAEGSKTGLGLGLYIAQQIAIAHGGTLQGRSNAEDGTVFSLRLPVR
jgi:signal transduction histidine kinase